MNRLNKWVRTALAPGRLVCSSPTKPASVRSVSGRPLRTGGHWRVPPLFRCPPFFFSVNCSLLLVTVLERRKSRANLTLRSGISHSSWLDVVAVAQIAGGCAGCVVRFRSNSAQLRRRQQRDQHGNRNSRLFARLHYDLNRRPALAYLHADPAPHKNSQTHEDGYPHFDAAPGSNEHQYREHRAGWCADGRDGLIQRSRYIHEEIQNKVRRYYDRTGHNVDLDGEHGVSGAAVRRHGGRIHDRICGMRLYFCEQFGSEQSAGWRRRLRGCRHMPAMPDSSAYRDTDAEGCRSALGFEYAGRIGAERGRSDVDLRSGRAVTRTNRDRRGRLNFLHHARRRGARPELLGQGNDAPRCGWFVTGSFARRDCGRDGVQDSARGDWS